jgi:hypothetical protein
VDAGARKIAAQTGIDLKHARMVAEAQLDLARIRRAKVSLIERLCAFGRLDPPLASGSAIKPAVSSLPMPSQEPDRTAEAVRRALPELIKLERYERRAAARRDKAVHGLISGLVEV